MNDDIILMGHGGGGALTAGLIHEIFLKELGNPILETLDDAACLELPGTEIVMSTDTFVIHPVFFPGGDIGKLAACGTINDVVMQGGDPLYMSLALVIEEGLPVADLQKIIRSVGEVLEETGVRVVTGDTKVVERRTRESGATGSAHSAGIFINTTGIGARLEGLNAAVSNAEAGDRIIVTGTLGDHGITIANLRHNLGLESELKSDTAPLAGMIKQVAEAKREIHCLRDPTRGGLAAALCDVAESSGCSIRVKESDLPVKGEVTGACDLLGFDIMNVPNEGKAVIVCPSTETQRVLDILKSHSYGRMAAVIGEVARDEARLVIMETIAGGERIVDVPAGEDLPRIC